VSLQKLSRCQQSSRAACYTLRTSAPVAQARSCYSVLQTVGEVDDCQGLPHFGRMHCKWQSKRKGAGINDLLQAEIAITRKEG
jgi:hypothetical protein